MALHLRVRLRGWRSPAPPFGSPDGARRVAGDCNSGPRQAVGNVGNPSMTIAVYLFVDGRGELCGVVLALVDPFEFGIRRGQRITLRERIDLREIGFWRMVGEQDSPGFLFGRTLRGHVRLGSVWGERAGGEHVLCTPDCRIVVLTGFRSCDRQVVVEDAPPLAARRRGYGDLSRVVP